MHGIQEPSPLFFLILELQQMQVYFIQLYDLAGDLQFVPRICHETTNYM